ncbi:MAG: hypothetical protein M1294_04795 [Firmicutes bacterium]|nr:hypothetical protein [Bacillota bacterium]MCL5013795.1 hypothetical protein [Bacillota bacterium]
MERTNHSWRKMVDERELDELSPEVLAAIMAAVLCVEDVSHGTTNVRIREVWPQESPWRWVGW